MTLTVAESVEQNLVGYFRHFAAGRENGDVAELDGVSIVSAGVRFYMFNSAFLSRRVGNEPAELEKCIVAAGERLRVGERRWAFWASEDKLANGMSFKVREAFRRSGLTFALRHPGMACEELRLPRRPLPALEVVPVTDRAGRLQIAHLNAIAFHIPFEWCAELYDWDRAWRDEFQGYVGFVAGEPVSTAATLYKAGVVGVYAVATAPGHERKGYAEALVRHAIGQAQERWGPRPTVLQSTRAGLSLYRRMGFEITGHFLVYAV